MTSKPEPISRDLSEINILQCISRLCAKEMPAICVAAGCSNLKDDVQGTCTSLYEIFRGRSSGSKEAKEENGRFCQTEESEDSGSHRSTLVICSVHFKPEDFEL